MLDGVQNHIGHAFRAGSVERSIHECGNLGDGVDLGLPVTSTPHSDQILEAHNPDAGAAPHGRKAPTRRSSDSNSGNLPSRATP